jgi:serine/threonine-protein kinase
MPPPPAAPAGRIDASILVIDSQSVLADGIKSVVGGVAPVRLVAAAEDAVKAMEAEEIALIVADLSSGPVGLATLFKLLKARHPEILTILVSDYLDSETVIELINQTQVYRFLIKPLDVRQLRGHIEAALGQYRAYKQRPELALQHRVDENEQAKASPFGAEFSERIRALPERLLSGEPGKPLTSGHDDAHEG